MLRLLAASDLVHQRQQVLWVCGLGEALVPASLDHTATSFPRLSIAKSVAAPARSSIGIETAASGISITPEGHSQPTSAAPVAISQAVKSTLIASARSKSVLVFISPSSRFANQIALGHGHNEQAGHRRMRRYCEAIFCLAVPLSWNFRSLDR